MRWVIVAVLGLVSVQARAELRCGAAAVAITPAVGTPLAGYYTKRPAEGVHDELYARALVFEQGGVKVAMVACDLVSIHRQAVEEARRLVEKETGIPAAHVMISATHTHTGPVLVGRSAVDASVGGDSKEAKEFVETLPQKIARSVKAANDKLAPAKLSAGVGWETGISFNRRYFMKDKSVGWNPGKKNPQIDRPAGPIDPDVSVIYVETADGKPLATHVNFAMHLDTVGGTQISADYAHALGALLAKVRGPEMLAVFTIGAAGDINHIDVSHERPQKGHAEAERIGTILGGEVIKTYARTQPVDVKAIAVKSEVVKLPLPEIAEGQLEAARKTAVKFGKDAPTFLERVAAFKVIDVSNRNGKPLDGEVQVIAFGEDLAVVALPGEIFVELGLEIKQRSPFRQTVIVELANGSVGYVPTKRAFAEGNYEPVSARCAAGSGEMLVEAALRLLEACKE